MELPPLTNKQFREYRIALGFTQRSLAELVGVEPEQVSRWERGKSKIPRHAIITVTQMVKSAKNSALQRGVLIAWLPIIMSLAFKL